MRDKRAHRRALLLLAFALSTSAASVTDYAPTVGVTCPDTPLLRLFDTSNQTLHPFEAEYIASRERDVLPNAWSDWIGDGSAIGYDAKQLLANASRVGIAVSGGGYRASLYAAGVLNALDSRNQSSKAAGTGGLLQVASYITGLSGGSWFVGSMILNDWPTSNELVFGNGDSTAGWLLDLNLAVPGGADLLSQDNQWFFGSLIWSIMAKAQMGIDTSITDPWARMISYHFLNQTTRTNFYTNDSAHGAGLLWSEIPFTPAYRQRLAPFPMVLADSRPVGSNLTTTLPPEPVVYEITPLEFGSYDPNLSAMVNLTYVGTQLVNGRPSNNTSCVTGFDQAGFVMGSSASLFNTLLDVSRNVLTGFTGADSKGLLYALTRLLTNVRTRANDVANWPSPFRGLKPGVFLDSDADYLELIDGGSNLENIPLGPLFVRARGLDAVVAVEGSAAGVNNWPDGTSPIYTAMRLKNLLSTSHQAFPPIPNSTDEFEKTGVVLRPTFFGCNPQQSPPEFPIVIYLPNAPPANGDDPVTNTNTFEIEYSQTHARAFLDQAQMNTISGFVPNALGADPNWGKCLQCAVVDRARLKILPVPARSDVCTKCFSQYCYDPSNPPSSSEIVGRKQTFKNPDLANEAKTVLKRVVVAVIGVAVGLLLLVSAIIAYLCWWRKRKPKPAKYTRVKDEETLGKRSSNATQYGLPGASGVPTIRVG